MKQNLSNGQDDRSQRAYRIASLICNFICKSLSDEEVRELNEWLSRNEANKVLFSELTDPVNIVKATRHNLN